ncbi:MAG: hypothetical protein GF344_07685, partial [Chitinivibrionales bacterium]|nr:hypothetical protein [Chitinivibrionales bacterium]MBD3356780.1 hypothetical protein [Chitinivibrionales bacterium]
SDNPKIEPDDLMGKTVTLSFDLPGGDKRSISGYVGEFHQKSQYTDMSEYTMVIVP